jgi:membrane associated rhomboid family serine protease
VYGRGGAQIRFGPAHTPDVIKWLLAINVALFLAQALGIAAFMVIEPRLVWESGQVWRLFTYMWVHGGPWHLISNLLMLWMFGSEIASVWGTEKFLRYYLVTGTGAGMIIALWQGALFYLGLSGPTMTLGASGAIYAVLLAHSLTWPDRRILLIIPPIPLRALYLSPFLFLMDLIFATPGVSHAGHLGGVLVGLALLAGSGDAGITISQLQYKFRRWRMRKKLRALDGDDERRRRQFH